MFRDVRRLFRFLLNKRFWALLTVFVGVAILFDGAYSAYSANTGHKETFPFNLIFHGDLTKQMWALIGLGCICLLLRAGARHYSNFMRPELIVSFVAGLMLWKWKHIYDVTAHPLVRDVVATLITFLISAYGVASMFGKAPHRQTLFGHPVRFGSRGRGSGGEQ